MSSREPTSVYRPGINAMLHEHEQKSAWLFFAVMSYMVMRLTPECGCTATDCGGVLWYVELWLGASVGFGHVEGVRILHSMAIGIWLLYCLKTASLFVRRSTAWAITGIMFIYCTDLWAGPSELNLVLQTVSMYHILVWARGKKAYFPPRHLLLAGMGITTALMTTPAAVVYWFPIMGLMLWVNRQRKLKSIAMAIGGIAIPYGLVGLAAIGISLSTNPHYPISTAPASLSILSGWGESLLANDAIGIFKGTLPGFCRDWIPAYVALIPGHLLLFMWLRPFHKIRQDRKVAINTTLATAFISVFWVSFCTAQPTHFTYLYPFILISLIGCILSIRLKIQHRTGKKVLRGIGLMLPFLTLLVLLLIPVLRTAMGEPPPAESKRDSVIENIVQSWVKQF